MLFVVKKTYQDAPEKDWVRKFPNFYLADNEYVSQSDGHEGGKASISISIRLENGKDALVEERALS